MKAPVARWAWRAIGSGLIILPALPIAAWLRATDRGPASWGANLTVWCTGLAGVAVTAYIAGRLAVRYRLRPIPALAPWRRWLPLTYAAGLVLVSGFFAHAAFAANPQLIDEVAQLFQARIFASGRVAAPAPVPPESFLFQLTTLTPAGWVSQFPPGHSLLLMLGLFARAEWLVNPLLAGLSALLLHALARGLYGPRTALTAIFLWAGSSWVMFMSASYMNHVSAVAFALAAWVLVFSRRPPGGIRLGVAGAALAAVAATRPLDAVAGAIPVGYWILLGRSRATGSSRAKQCLAVTIGALPILAAWGYVNWRLFGSPWSLGYSTLYGPAHNLGFHADPYGESFTPWIALSNMAVAIRRLHIYLFEWPVPALLPLALWALLARHAHPADKVLGIGAVAVPLLYFFYWHSGFFLGPRFYYGAAPWLVLGTARAWTWGWARARRRRTSRFSPDGAIAAAALLVLWWGWTGFLPDRFRTYRDSLPTLKLHPERKLQALGVSHALVIVPESWGSRVIVGLWALGVSPGLVEAAYRRVDLCDLHLLQVEARASALGPAETADRVLRLQEGTVPAVPRIPGAPDPSLRLRTDRPLPRECRAELERDRDGFTVFGNLAWRNSVGLDSGIIFARDRHEQNGELFARYPGWQVWRFAPPPGQPLSLPVLVQVAPGGG